MRAAWHITAKDLRLRLRDRSAVLVGVVVPLVLAFIFNAVFGGAFGEGSIATIGFVDEDGGEVAQGLEEALEDLDSEGIIGMEELDGEVSLRSRIEEGELPAGIVVPPGFSEAAFSGGDASLKVVGEVDSPTAMSIARGISEGFAIGVEDAQRAVQTLVQGGGVSDPDRIATLAEAAATAGPLVTIGTVEAAERVMEPSTFFSAGMAVFFLFFLVQFGVTGLLDEEREGTLTRLHAAPIPRWSVVAGKALTSFVLGIVALTVLAVATSWIMDADWGDPVGLAVLFMAVTLAATSLVGIVGALARTPEGAGNMTAIIAVGMGMLGGTFFPVGSSNRILEFASLATPHSWFMRGIGDLRAGDSVAASSSILGLLVFALVGGAVAAALLARRYR